MPLDVDVLTLFPAMVEGPLSESIPARILEHGLATVRVHDLRRWGLGRHRTVDDYTYGGGAGMVLRPEVVAAALAELRRPDSTVILLDPAGGVFRQATAHALAERPHLVFLCPRYEGVDERIRAMVDLELSIGDYVLTGGELAALVILDAVLRLLPGAIDAASTTEESFAAGLLEYPQYTRRSRRCWCRGTTSRCGCGGSRSHCAGPSIAARTSWLAASRRRRRRSSSPSCARRPRRRRPSRTEPRRPERAAPGPRRRARRRTGPADSLSRDRLPDRGPPSCYPPPSAVPPVARRPEPVTPAAAAADDRTRIHRP